MPTLTLTQAQLVQLRKDMNEQVEMLSDEEINALAEKVNAEINIPFLSEEKEFVTFSKIIRFIDRQLYKLLPNEVYAMVKSTSDGISEEEARQMLKRITPMVNNVVNIPILTEIQEYKLIDLVLEIIMNALIIGLKLDEKGVEN